MTTIYTWIVTEERDLAASPEVVFLLSFSETTLLCFTGGRYYDDLHGSYDRMITKIDKRQSHDPYIDGTFLLPTRRKPLTRMSSLPCLRQLQSATRGRRSGRVMQEHDRLRLIPPTRFGFVSGSRRPSGRLPRGVELFCFRVPTANRVCRRG